MFIRLGSFFNEAATTKKKQIPLSSVNGSLEVLMNSGFSVFWQPEKTTPHRFPLVMTLRSERVNSILMTWHYRDLGGASDWLKQISLAARPIRSTTKIWVVTHYQYMEFTRSLLKVITRENKWWRGGNCRLFSQVKFSIKCGIVIGRDCTDLRMLSTIAWLTASAMLSLALWDISVA